jgi:hypothetical protein
MTTSLTTRDLAGAILRFEPPFGRIVFNHDDLPKLADAWRLETDCR